MAEPGRPFLTMLTVALLLHGVLLVWWKIPQTETVPIPERPVIQMIKLAEPPVSELPPEVQPPAQPLLPPTQPQPQLVPSESRPEPKPLPAPEPAPVVPQLLSPDPPPPQVPVARPLPVAEASVALPTPAPDALAGYEAQLAAWLAKHKNYPLAAQRRHQEGEVLLRVRINRAGQVLSFRLQDRSNYTILDEAALAMVKRAEPFPPFPADFPGVDFEFLLPVSFRLR